ncbi:MAG: hypothetical protein AABY95_06010 [Pseudomonadota bacterium]
MKPWGPLYSVLFTTVAALACPAAHAEGLDVLRYAISGGTPNLDARLRYEQVDQGPPSLLATADAVTFRLRLGYTTGKWNATDISAEFENTSSLFGESYNSTSNGKVGYSVVADPVGGELNQFWIRNASLPGTVLKLGRQRLIFDNARFIGNVGWRSNEMTYDSVLATNTSLPKTQIDYAYLKNARTFLLTDFPMRGHVFHVTNTALSWLSLTGYAYLIDFTDVVAARQDTQSVGLRATGAAPITPTIKALYTAEYARQNKYGSAPSFVSASYYLGEAGVAFAQAGCIKDLTAKLGYEVLGGNGAYGFQTPLATLHAFQGWADVFLATPATGIREYNATVSGTVEKVALFTRWHHFSADTGGMHYGNEFDVQATRPIIENFVVGAKYAYYTASSLATDTRKAWLWLEYKF